jgi:hypothetical protein
MIIISVVVLMKRLISLVEMSLRALAHISLLSGCGTRRVPVRWIEMLAYDAAAGIREFERLNRAVMDANPPLEVPIAATYTLAHASKAHKRRGWARAWQDCTSHQLGFLEASFSRPRPIVYWLYARYDDGPGFLYS